MSDIAITEADFKAAADQVFMLARRTSAASRAVHALLDAGYSYRSAEVCAADEAYDQLHALWNAASEYLYTVAAPEHLAALRGC